MVSLSAGSHGTLNLDGTAIASADLPKTVTRTELDQDKLVFEPATDQDRHLHLHLQGGGLLRRGVGQHLLGDDHGETGAGAAAGDGGRGEALKLLYDAGAGRGLGAGGQRPSR